MKYFCCEEERRSELAKRKTLNGIDFLEVIDDPSLPDETRQKTLLVYFFFGLVPGALKKENVRIDGGTRIRSVQVEWVCAGDSVPVDALDPEEKKFLPDSPDDLKRLLVVRTGSNGDFSRYVLRIVRKADAEIDGPPPAGFDPILSAVEFSFKAGCPSEFDCLNVRVCPPKASPQPDIDYLAKDYASFRRLMLDRMKRLAPRWEERNPADMGVALVEWLAYVGDRLSYRQDAVATEAYLATARRRVSVRRHARLVDYFMHEGCNARTWVQVEVQGSDSVDLSKGAIFLAKSPAENARITVAEFERKMESPEDLPVFQSMHDAVLYEEHNRMDFHSWGNKRCCLPAGATKATLRGYYPNLKAGEVLVIKEAKNPRNGEEADADPLRRHPVRLTHVLSRKTGPPAGKLKDPLLDLEITEIEWDEKDALPFPFCISAVTDKEHGEKEVEDASRVLGNIVLADHGYSRAEEKIRDGANENVPEMTEVYPEGTDRGGCQVVKPVKRPPRFRPAIKGAPLTFSAPCAESPIFEFEPGGMTPDDLSDALTKKTFPQELKDRFQEWNVDFRAGRLSIQGSAGEWSLSDGVHAFLVRRSEKVFSVHGRLGAATGTGKARIGEALPSIVLRENGKPGEENEWRPVRDLLGCGEDDRKFLIEIDDDGTAFVRFGDDVYGTFPDPRTHFRAEYRLGNGMGGNVGAGALSQIASDDNRIAGASNPLPAIGGTEPETVEHVRKTAPFAFRRQERAVTEDDYAEMAKLHPGVQKAVATFRWTGSWHTVFLTIDRKGGLPVDPEFRREMRDHIERYRLAGYDLVVDAPRPVSLEIEMLVCVKPGYLREDVKKALLDRFGCRLLPDGRLGVFHPDRFTFGTPVYLSRIYEAALSVDGVQSLQVIKFRRQGLDSRDAIGEGVLVLGRLEIARLENDPMFPDHGVLRIQAGGGR